MRFLMSLVLIAWCFISSQLHAQACDLNLSGSGARAEGFGQAFIGISDDATAVVWNPGGLTQLRRPEVSAVGRMVSEASGSHTKVNFASFAYPITRDLVVAGVYQEQIDFTFDIGGGFKSDGGAKTVSIGGAYRITPVLSAGAVVNSWFGSVEYDFQGFPFEEKSKGINGVVGIMADLNGLDNAIPLKIGVVARSTGAKPIEDFKLPWMYGLGASYRIGENITVASDVEMRNFGSIDGGKNTMQFRAGGEYLWITDNFVIPVRGGFRTVPQPFGGETSKGFSGGSGLILKQFAIDATFTHLVNSDIGNTNVVMASAIVYFR